MTSGESKQPIGLNATLPNSWRITTLRSLTTEKFGTICPTSFPDEEFEYYSIPAFQENGRPINELGRRILSNKLVVKDGTVLFGKLNPRVLKVWLVNSHSTRRKIATTEFLPILPNATATSEYIYFVCQSDIVLSEARRLVSGSTPSRERVEPSSFYKIKIPLPPIAEQQSIANVLQTVQHTKETRQRELALERERKAALMAHLFTHGTRGEATKETEIGEIPESWRTIEVEAVAEVGNGSTPSRANERYWNGGTIPWITSTKVHEVIIKNSDEFVTEAARSECHLPMVPAHSLVVAITGQGKTLGNAAILEFDTCINQHLAYIHITDETLEPYFALFYFRSKYQYFRGVSSGGGSTKGALTCGFLKRMKIPVPSQEEQKGIAELLSACEVKCHTLEREIGLLDEFFVAALDELMSGRLDVAALIDGGSNG